MAQYRWSAPFNVWDLLSLRALRIWPEDGHEQMEFLRHCYRALEIHLEKELPEFDEAPDMHHYLKYMRMNLGGREALSKLKQPNQIDLIIEKRSVRGQWAGTILTFAHMLHTGDKRDDLISWNRIVDFIERESHSGKGWKPVSRTVLVESWKQYETVAHLWASHMYLGGVWHKGATFPDCSVHEEMELNLAYAKTFQDFGLNFRARKSKKHFLNEDIFHKINIHLKGDIDWGPLPPHILDSIKDF